MTDGTFVRIVATGTFRNARLHEMDDEMAMSDSLENTAREKYPRWVKRVWHAVRWDGTMIAPTGSLAATIYSSKVAALKSLRQEEPPSRD